MMQTKANSHAQSPDSLAAPATEGHSRFGQDIPPLGVDTGQAVNKKGLVFIGVVGLCGLAASFWLFSGGDKRASAAVKPQTEDVVHIPERKFPPEAKKIAPLVDDPSARGSRAPGGAQAIPLASDAQAGNRSTTGASADGGAVPYDPKNPTLDQRRAMDALVIQPSQVVEKSKGGAEQTQQTPVVDDSNALMRRRTVDGGRVSYTANSAAAVAAAEPFGAAAPTTSGNDPTKDLRALLGNAAGGRGVPKGAGGAMVGRSMASGDADTDGANTIPAEAFPVQAARKIPTNPDFSILQGTSLRCLMNTRLISDIPGQVVCTITENILSNNARKVLIPKGTKVIGEYGGQANASLERVGIVWHRLITPANIDIALGSPGTDPLGSTGVPGYVDEKWRLRIGAASLITLTSDIIKLAIQKNAPTTTTTTTDPVTGRIVVTETPFDSATVRLISRAPDPFLARVLNMPATILIQQGAVVAIQTAKDLDFSDVYENKQ